MRLLLLICVGWFLRSATQVYGQGVRGKVTTQAGEALPYTNVLVQGTSLGTLSNAEGEYQLSLSAGTYTLVFQYLSFKTVTRTVTIQSDWITLPIKLEEQPLTLGQADVGKGKEDPAYTVMRRAIAKARFHQLQVIGYTARAYTRSTALPTKIPLLLERSLKKEGVQEGKAFLNESVAEISYARPATYKQRVISTRNSLDNSIPTPNQYVLASFYSPEIAATISPLSPKAFSAYKFEYEGFFEDRGEIVNKIKVIPRAYGEGVFKGSIFILEDRWSIHSLDLQTVSSGLQVSVKQVCSPIQNIWMPVNQQFKIKGGYLGFAGEFGYVVSLKYDQLRIDPALKEDITLSDHKKEPEKATATSRKQKLDQLITEQKDFSTKNFRKLVKEFEKEQKKERKAEGDDLRVVRNDSITIDSLANRRDTTYWQTLRPIPLTPTEVKSYQWQDSIKIVKMERQAKDSIRTDSTRFRPLHLLLGHTYKLSAQQQLQYSSPLMSLQYNTVEGFVMDASLRYTRRWEADCRWSVQPLLRYAAGRRDFLGTLQTEYRTRRWNTRLEAGNYRYQLNPQEPISPSLNTFTTLYFKQNFVHLLQKDFVKASYEHQYLADVLSLRGSFELARRHDLSNLENPFSIFRWPERTFRPNQPEHLSGTPTGFDPHEGLWMELSATLRPWQRYAIRNGQKRYWYNNGPTFEFLYRKAFALTEASPTFDFVSVGIRHRFDTSARSDFQLSAEAGTFLGQRRLYFADYAHFLGNEFWIQTGDPLRQFRMLPLYQYSTDSRFFKAHALWTTSRLVITQLPFVRMAGIKETLQLHYLHTPATAHYTEMVYGLDGLFRLFRVEVVGQFMNGRYQSTGLRIGTQLRLR